MSLSLYNQPLLPRSVYTFSDLFRSHVYFQTFVHWSELTLEQTGLHIHAHAESDRGDDAEHRDRSTQSQSASQPTAHVHAMLSLCVCLFVFLFFFFVFFFVVQLLAVPASVCRWNNKLYANHEILRTRYSFERGGGELAQTARSFRLSLCRAEQEHMAISKAIKLTPVPLSRICRTIEW